LSKVTNIIINIGMTEDKHAFVGHLNAYGNPVFRLAPIYETDWYTGSKVLEADLVVAALNHLDLTAFLGHIGKYKFKDIAGQSIQVFVKAPESEKFVDEWVNYLYGDHRNESNTP
jgi:hypothetical protein